MKTRLKHRQLSVERLESRQMLAPFFSAALDADPGWTTSGEWAFGHPTGGGGKDHGFPDPQSGYTGETVYGVNLNGDYSFGTSGGTAHYLTTGTIDCTGYHGIQLSFYRKLNIDRSDQALATIDVSNNGTVWNRVYTNLTDVPVMDQFLAPVTYDISAYADYQSAVRIRWGYQVTSTAYPYSGWNIDDVTLTGTAAPTSTWDGGSTANSLWTTAANWVGDVVPAAGSHLVFPDEANRKESINDFSPNVKFGSIDVVGSGYIFHGALSTNDVQVPSAIVSMDSVAVDTLTIGLRHAAAGRSRVESVENAAPSYGAEAIAVAPCVADRDADLNTGGTSVRNVAKDGGEQVAERPQTGPTLQNILVSNDLTVMEVAGKPASLPEVTTTVTPRSSVGRVAARVTATESDTASLATLQFDVRGGHAAPRTETWPTSTRAERRAKRLPDYYADSPIASLAATERALEQYRQREISDRANLKALPEGRTGRTDKPFKDAVDAILAADWAW